MPEPTRPTLVLFPGLGADHTCWEPQRAVRAEVVTPPWLEPRRRETLIDYAGRMAEGVPRVESLYVGGASFGGMVALEVARIVRPRAVFLIASCRSPAAIAVPMRLAGAAQLVPAMLIRLMRHWPAPRGALGVVPPSLMQWGPRAIARWRLSGELPCPVHHIHGARDRMIPVKRLVPPPGELVPGAGHLVSLTHAEAVNAFVQKHLAAHERAAGSAGW